MGVFLLFMLRSAIWRGVGRVSTSRWNVSSSIPLHLKSSFNQTPTSTFIRYNSNLQEKDLGNRIDPVESLDMKSELTANDSSIIEEHVSDASQIAEYDFSSFIHILGGSLMQIHDVYQVPWYALIMGTSVVVKTLRDSIPEGREKAMRVGQAVKEHYASKGISTTKMMSSMFLQMPLTIYMFFEVRALAISKVPGMADEGLLWFTNLSVPDPLFLLPVCSTCLFLANAKLSHMYAQRLGLSPNPTTELMQKVFTYIFPFMGILLAFLPAASQLLIVSNAFLQFAMVLLFRIKAFRTIFKLPPNIGVNFSLTHSDPKKVVAAFGKDFINTAPPPLNKKFKKSFLERTADKLKQ